MSPQVQPSPIIPLSTWKAMWALDQFQRRLAQIEQNNEIVPSIFTDHAALLISS